MFWNPWVSSDSKLLKLFEEIKWFGLTEIEQVTQVGKGSLFHVKPLSFSLYLRGSSGRVWWCCIIDVIQVSSGNRCDMFGFCWYPGSNTKQITECQKTQVQLNSSKRSLKSSPWILNLKFRPCFRRKSLMCTRETAPSHFDNTAFSRD